MTTWRDKANRVISADCMAEWREANTLPNGRRRKRHVPYSVPKTAQELVECLKSDDEERAKAIFIRLAVTGY